MLKIKKVKIFANSDRYYCSSACGIDLGDSYVVTGGEYSKKRVTQYSETGEVTFLANLTTGRWAHACGKYLGDKGDQVSVMGNITNSELSSYII